MIVGWGFRDIPARVVGSTGDSEGRIYERVAEDDTSFGTPAAC